MQMATGVSALTAVVGDATSHQLKMAEMRSEVAAMTADVETIRREAAVRASQLEQRQAFLAALLSGEGDAAKLNAMIPAKAVEVSDHAADATAPLDEVAAAQLELVKRAKLTAETRYVQTASMVRRLGLTPERFHDTPVAMGGPFEPITGALTGKADPAFKALFQSWKKLDQIETGVVAIPSSKPVKAMTFTSGFGVRSDPFRGGRAMHAGIDISGPIGTPIYATADGIVGRSQWANGYGNLIEIEHGKGIQTRYGHLSQSLVTPMRRVKRGDLIGLMGSTGRSTGSHLHYEVRIDGHAVNPMPFLQSSDYLLNVQARATAPAKVGLGGPAN
jgi:murein DD-endopeptidase MepM/ murein hydrolase activator NlpD